MHTIEGAYRRLRRDDRHLRAAAALAMARREREPTWAGDFEESHEGGTWVGDVDGWHVTITAKPDDDVDISWLGKWTNDPDGAVPNPDYAPGRYRYFRPEPHEMPKLADYFGLGMSRHDARLAAAAAAAELPLLALAERFVVAVTVRYLDVELGWDSLGGVGAEHGRDVLWAVEDHDMLARAVLMAEAKLAALVAGAA